MAGRSSSIGRPEATSKTEDEAVRLANDTPYALNAYVFSRDKRRARALADQMRSGSVTVNDVLYTYGAPETPWGGVKQSGIGRIHGEQALRDLWEMRRVNVERFHVPIPWMFPYRASFHAKLLRVLKRVGRWFS